MQIANNLGKLENSELSLTYRLCKFPVYSIWIGPRRGFEEWPLLWESKIPDSIWTGMPCIKPRQFLELKVFLNIDVKP